MEIESFTMMGLKTNELMKIIIITDYHIRISENNFVILEEDVKKKIVPF